MRHLGAFLHGELPCQRNISKHGIFGIQKAIIQQVADFFSACIIGYVVPALFILYKMVFKPINIMVNHVGVEGGQGNAVQRYAIFIFNAILFISFLLRLMRKGVICICQRRIRNLTNTS